MQSFLLAYFRSLANFVHAPFSWLRHINDRHFTYKLQLVFSTILFIAFFFLSAQNLIAQSDIQWDRTIGGIGGDGLYIAEQTADGGYILGGISGYGINGNQQQPGRGEGDYWVVKVSATGAVEWDKVFGGSKYDELNVIHQTADGGYILGGNSVSDKGGDKSEDNNSVPDQDGAMPYDYWIIKISANGTKEWDRTYGGLKEDFFVTLKVAQDGGYIIGGGANGALNVLKLAADGSKVWERNHGSGTHTSIGDLTLTPDGGYLVGGSTASGIGGDKSEPSRGGYDFWVLKIAADGTKEWDKTFGGTNYDDLISVNTTSDGGYLLVGNTDSPGIGGDKSEVSNGNYDAWIVKIKSNGTKQWDKTLGASKYLNQNNYFSARTLLSLIRENADGSFLLGGFADGHASEDKTGNVLGAWTIKLAANGSKISDRSLGVPISNFLSTPDGGYLLYGSSSANAGPIKTENSKGSSDAWLIKYAPQIPAKTLAFSGQNLSFTYKPGNVTPTQTITLTASAGTPDLIIIKSDNTPWLKIPQAGTGPLTFSIDANGLTAGTYTAAVTLFASGYTRAVVQVKLLVISEEANNAFVRINAGGAVFAASGSRQFRADQYFAGIDRTSSVASGDILNTTDDELYRSGRCSPSFSYNIPMPNGKVNVILHFAEIWYGVPGKGAGGAGKRQFDVTIENSRKLTNFDIFTAAGGAMRAVQKSIPVTITDGMLNIDFTSGVADLPRVSAIEVVTSSVTLKPVADTYIEEYGFNYGKLPNLEVKDIPRDNVLLRYSYLKFPISIVGKVGSAKLRVYGHNHENTKEIYLHAYGVNDDSWIETELGTLASSDPPPASTPSLGSVSVNDVFQYYEIDVTSYMKAQQQAGDSLVSFMLKDPKERNTRLTFNSRENGANPPQLVIIPAPETNAAARTGQEEISVVTEAEPEQSSVYPNPAGKQFTVQLSTRHSENISFDLLNNSGQSYKVVTAEKARAGQKAEVDISALALSSGIYMLKIHSEATTEVIKILVTE